MLKHYKSCGCLQKEVVKNIVQKIQPEMRFGYLVTIEFDQSNETSAWVCKCDCGAVKSVRSYRLLKGAEKSCGCKSEELRQAAWKLKRADDRTRNLRKRFWDYQKSARDKNLPFELSFEETLQFLNADCFYCGLPALDSESKMTGIDRINNANGYLMNNCVPCCWTCNRRKAAMSYEDFTAWVLRIANRLKRKKRTGVSTRPLDVKPKT